MVPLFVAMCFAATFTSCPVVVISKRQECVAHSTPEAVMVALSFALRMVGLPDLDLRRTFMKALPPVGGAWANRAMIRILKTGRNPTMKYVGPISHNFSGMAT